MATVTPNRGTNTAQTVTNLQSLADDAYWQSDNINNASGIKLELFLTIVTTTTVGDANGDIQIFMAGSNDGGTDFAGGASGTEGSYADSGDADPGDLRFLDSMKCDAVEAVARTYRWHGVFEDLAEDFAIVLRNRSGAALAASSNAVETRLNNFDVT